MDLERAFQKSGRAKNGSLIFTTATTGSQTLVAALDALHTVYVQRIVVTIQTSAAQSITFQDTAGAPVYVAKVSSSPGTDTRWEFNFGPKGLPLTLGKDLVAVFSSTGLAGHMEWNTYQLPQ